VPSHSPIDYCSECVKLLGDYVDGSLPPEQSAALERHLSMCMPCITFMRTYKATGHLCRAKLAREMPQELKKGLASFLATRVPGFVPPSPAPSSAQAEIQARAAEPPPVAPLAKKAT
jgi:anti-sigma factor RsiW